MLEQLSDFLQPQTGQNISVNAGNRVLLKSRVDLRKITHRAADTDKRLLGMKPRQLDLFQGALNVGTKCTDFALGRRIVPQEGLAQPQRTEWQAARGARLAIAKTNDLNAAPAEVEKGSVVDGQCPDSSKSAVVSLFDGVDQLDTKAELDPGSPDQLHPVLGIPHRCSCDCNGPARPMRPYHCPKVGQSLECGRDRFRAQPPVAVDFAHQPQRRASAAQNAQLSRCLTMIDNQACRVRPDIDDCKWIRSVRIDVRLPGMRHR